MPVTHIQPSAQLAPDILHSGPLLSDSMTLLWLRIAVLLYGVAALAVLPAALYNRPRWCNLAVPSTIAAAMFHFVSLAENSQRRAPPPAGGNPTKFYRCWAAYPCARISRRLCLVSAASRSESLSSPSSSCWPCSPPSVRPGDLLHAHPHRLDLSSHRPAVGRLRRAGGFTPGVSALPHSENAASSPNPADCACFRLSTPRSKPSTRSP